MQATAQTGQIAQLPPSPKEPKIRQAFGLGHGIWQYLEKHQKQFGDAFTLRLPGQGPMVILADPVMIKDVFSLKPDQYDPSLVQLPMDLGEHNTVFLNNKEHQDSRKMIIPSLNTDRLRARAGVMHEIVNEHINSWRVNDRYDIPRVIGDMTMDVICYTLLGLRYGPRKDRYKTVMLNWLQAACSDTMFAIGSFYGAKKFRQKLNRVYLKRTAEGQIVPPKKALLPWDKAIDLKVQLADMMRQDIRDIRARNDESEFHMLSLMARTRDADGNLLDEERVISEGIGLLIAGHETSAATAAWFMIWLLKRPDVMAKIRAEVKQCIQTEGHYDPIKVAELPYLTACLNESQRLCPSAVGTVRWLTQDTKIGNLFLPAHSAVLPCTYLTQRRKDVFGPDAEEYRPERWQEGNKWGPNEFFPFGGGRRACAGMNQARQQLRIIFAEFARRVSFDSDLAGNDKWPVPRQIGGQTEPDGGVWVTIKEIRPETTDFPETAKVAAEPLRQTA